MNEEMNKINQMNNELDKAIQNYNQYKTKTYIFDWQAENELITICYVTELPKVNEQIIIHENDGEFKTYVVSRRIMGVNKNTGGSVWNLYVRQIKNN